MNGIEEERAENTNGGSKGRGRERGMKIVTEGDKGEESKRNIKRCEYRMGRAQRK